MKTIKRILIIATIMLLSMVLVSGQEKVEVAEDYAGAVTFEYTEANYTDGILTFSGLSEEAFWLRILPTTKISSYDTPGFIADWQFENNSVELLLQIDTGFVRLAVSVADYDSLLGELKLNAEIVEVISSAKLKDNKQALKNLTAGELVIPMNADFATSIYAGNANRMSSTRGGSTSCAPDC